MFGMPGRSHEGPLPALTEAQQTLQTALEVDLVHLAVAIGERNVFRPDPLRESADWIHASLEEAGYETSRQSYVVHEQDVFNVVGERTGTTTPEEIVVIGAHYDTVRGCPGANDNGTGVVATLALARAFAEAAPERTLRFVLFVNEEPPYFQTKDMGSLVYARACRERNEKIVGMLSLETIGYFADEEGSQKYPFPVGLFYPSTGNFITFVSNVGSRTLIRQAVGSFRRTAAFPSVGAAVPAWIQGVGWSDHWSFWKVGYPALMVTDTAPFRYEPYHTPYDTVDQVDFERFARVVDGLRGVVSDLAKIP